MTRGRQTNVAHLVAESVEDARKQWIDVFSRDRADLGPAHARGQAIDAIDRYGPAAMRRTASVPPPPAAAPSYGQSSWNRALIRRAPEELRERT